MTEVEKYRSNVQEFLTVLNGTTIKQIALKTDPNPTFNKTILPFRFEYCFSIKFITDNGVFQLQTAMTTTGIDTFWIESPTSLESGDLIKPVYSKVKAIDYTLGHNDFAYKLTIELEDQTLVFFAAEIYNTADKKYECKINDEMILFFDDKREAEKLEAQLNYS